VPLLHRNLAASVDNIVRHYQLTPDDVSLCIMPLFHVHGLIASALATLASGGTVVIPEKFSPLGFWPIARDTKPTWFSASPTPHQMILMRGAEERPPGTERLRFVRSCSAALAPALMGSMERRFGVPVLEAYGMTEASHQMSSNPLPPGPRYPGSVGIGTGVRIAVLDDRGGEMATGATGQVGIRGANVIEGYENNPEANASSFINGWFLTGDQGTLDSAGYLRLLGRIKELINRGGEKIAPREIDEALELHPKVKEAVAFGVPHPTWGRRSPLPWWSRARSPRKSCRRTAARPWRISRCRGGFTSSPRYRAHRPVRSSAASSPNNSSRNEAGHPRRRGHRRISRRPPHARWRRRNPHRSGSAPEGDA